MIFVLDIVKMNPDHIGVLVLKVMYYQPMRDLVKILMNAKTNHHVEELINNVLILEEALNVSIQHVPRYLQ